MTSTATEVFTINLSTKHQKWATCSVLNADLTAEHFAQTVEKLPTRQGSQVKIIFESPEQLTEVIVKAFREKYGAFTAMWHKHTIAGRTYPETHQREYV